MSVAPSTGEQQQVATTDTAARLRGVIAPVLTPFTSSGALDAAAFRAEVRYVLDAGVHGISPGGSTGEGATLSDDELAEMLRIIHEENHDGVPVVAGVIRTSTRDALRTARRVRDAGADALMVTPTFYNVLVPDDEGNRAFFQTLSDGVGLPLVIYNVIPQNPITSELAVELLEIEHVIGVKQSVGGIAAMYDMRLLSRGRGLVYAATDEMLASCYTLGADGAISAVLTLFPRSNVEMWNLAQEGRHDEAIAIQDRLYPVWRLLRGAQFPARMKAATQALGRNAGYPREPLQAVDGATRALIEQTIASVGEV